MAHPAARQMMSSVVAPSPGAAVRAVVEVMRLQAGQRSASAQMSAETFSDLFGELCAWGAWGADDVLGALN